MQREFSIWFLIGLLLTIYGALILCAGIYGIWNPPAVVLAELHAGVWWGAVMLAMGLVYLKLFAPKR